MMEKKIIVTISETSFQLGNINHAYPYYILITMFGSKCDSFMV